MRPVDREIEHRHPGIQRGAGLPRPLRRRRRARAAGALADRLPRHLHRIGRAWDRTLLYIKGGGAVADDRYRATCSTLVGACLGTGLAVGDTLARADETRWGWLIGAGLEWAFTPNWSAKIEYNFMDFGRERLNFGLVGGGTVPFDIDQHIHVVKAGINYRFNFGGPHY
jgi:outer membrane immunogenic protein